MPSRKGATFAIIILFIINILNFYDRNVAGALVEPMRKEFHLSDTQVGLLGTAFTVLYAIIGVPLGRIAAARSGDKGGSANVGVWVRSDEQWRWLANTLTIELLKQLLPETADLPVTRHLLPNLRAVNFVIEEILGQGVAYQARFDPQAKGLGEWLRSRHVDIPAVLL